MDSTKLRELFFSRLHSSNEILGLFDLLPGVSFFVKDRQGRFIALNKRGCDYCGVASEKEAVGKTDFDFFPNQRAKDYQSDDLAVIASGEAIINRIESAPEAAGSPRLVMTTKVPLRDKQGRVIGTAGFSRQIDRLHESKDSVSAFARSIETMHERYAENLSTAVLAASAGLSISQFERRFRSAFGSSVRQYLLRIRVENAAKLLVETEHTVSKIALDSGFFDHAHFSRSFKKLMNQSPSDYRMSDQYCWAQAVGPLGFVTRHQAILVCCESFCPKP